MSEPSAPKISLTDSEEIEKYEEACDDFLVSAFNEAKVKVNDRHIDVEGAKDNIDNIEHMMELMDMYAHSAWQDICKESGPRAMCSYCDQRFTCWTT